MYLNFFKLKKEPFQITPDPSFLYLSPGHKEALASIIYGVEKKKGFVLIVGAVGVGKTTILRAYLEKVEKERLRTIYLFNSNISYQNLLRYIFGELGLTPVSDDVCAMVNQLQQALVKEYREGRNVLLLIDEAQNMPIDTLENLRMLSNLETATEKLIQIVFSAQPEFEKTLSLEELKQLKQRIAVKAVISPLTMQEGLTYIDHRLRQASDTESVLFTGLALKEIVRNARGIPRVINVLCDNCLITAFGYGKSKVGLAVVREIVADFGIQRPFRWRLAAALGAVLILGVCFGLSRTLPMPKASTALAPPALKMPQRTVAAVKAESVPVEEEAVVSRVVKRGDTLAKLIKEVYGRVSPRLIREVKEANPQIDNENLIVEGGSIIFPARKRE